MNFSEAQVPLLVSTVHLSHDRDMSSPQFNTLINITELSGH